MNTETIIQALITSGIIVSALIVIRQYLKLKKMKTHKQTKKQSKKQETPEPEKTKEKYPISKNYKQYLKNLAKEHEKQINQAMKKLQKE